MKRHYILIEPTDGTQINGCDSWLCPWIDLEDFLTPTLEEIEAGVPFTVKLTVLEMDDDEYAAYCVEHEVEIDE